MNRNLNCYTFNYLSNTSWQRHSNIFWLFPLSDGYVHRVNYQYLLNQSIDNFPSGHFSTFLGQIWSKKSKLSFKAGVWWIQWWYALFLCFRRELTLFGQIWSKIIKIVCFKLKFVTLPNVNTLNTMVIITFSNSEWK